MSSWETDFHGISVQYTDHLIQIKTDKKLLDFLAKKGKGSVELSKHIRERYQDIFKKELQITEDSLAVEILIHAYLDVFLEGIENAGKLLPAGLKKQLISVAENIKSHTEIIDCGEREVDSNRKIFDALVPYREILYLILGEKA